MKKITNKTILKQGDKTFQPIEDIDESIFWEDSGCNVVAQSSAHIEGIPVIDLCDYVEKLADDFIIGQTLRNRGFEKDGWISTGFVYGYQANPNQYTQKDIEKVIELARKGDENWQGYVNHELTTKEILEQINSISVIEVDEQFNIISYE